MSKETEIEKSITEDLQQIIQIANQLRSKFALFREQVRAARKATNELNRIMLRIIHNDLESP